MAEKPSPPPPSGNGGAFGHGLNAVRLVTGMTQAQVITLIAVGLNVAVLAGAGYGAFVLFPRIVTDITAGMMRTVAEISERGREERERDREDRRAQDDRDREVNRLRDERFLTAFAAESERTRQATSESSKTLMAVVLALTKEVAKLQAQLSQNTEAMQKLQTEVNALTRKIGPGEVFDLIPCPLPMREVPPVAPMPRSLTRG